MPALALWSLSHILSVKEDRYTFISSYVPLSFDKQPLADDIMRSFAAVCGFGFCFSPHFNL